MMLAWNDYRRELVMCAMDAFKEYPRPVLGEGTI
jgi:hypothetical protein